MKKLDEMFLAPLPWECKTWTNEDEYGVNILDANGKGIVGLTDYEDLNDEMMPTATLLAAAPLLYQALYDIMQVSDGIGLSEEERKKRMDEALARGRDAMKQAVYVESDGKD